MIRRIFDIIEGRIPRPGGSKGPMTYQCVVSYLEIYNDEPRDLLDIGHGAPGEKKKKLEVRHHPDTGAFVPGLTECVCKSSSDVDSAMVTAMKSRSVAATAMNDASSR